MLSRYRDEQIGRSERLAVAIADHVPTSWFAGTLLMLPAAWIVVNVAWQPFEPHPVVTQADSTVDRIGSAPTGPRRSPSI